MTYLRDYQHASQIFRSNLFKNAPKLKFLFHTYFDIYADAYDADLSTGNNFGLLVRDVKLPSYTFNTVQLNQYNRKRIVQTKIKYENVSITFHDDNNNMINQLWEAYYRYYYRDGSKPKIIFGGTNASVQTGAGGVTISGLNGDYNARTTYDKSITGNADWGYIGETSNPSNGEGIKVPFFKTITVFGFHLQNYIAYTLINPMITAFAHDQYNYDEGGGTMKNTMTLDYETVVYNYGKFDHNNPAEIIKGFALPEAYDRTISPIEV